MTIVLPAVVEWLFNGRQGGVATAPFAERRPEFSHPEAMHAFRTR